MFKSHHEQHYLSSNHGKPQNKHDIKTTTITSYCNLHKAYLDTTTKKTSITNIFSTYRLVILPICPNFALENKKQALLNIAEWSSW